jgi:hypothetical protein
VPISTTEGYDRALSVVRSVIHEWDPYALLAGGAPDDEFDQQIAQLVARSRKIESPADATHAISEIFSSSFDAADFRPESCAAVGRHLFAALSAAGLLSNGVPSGGAA